EEAAMDLEDFLTKLDENPVAALDEYRLEVTEVGLDVVKGTGEDWVETGFRQIDVAFDDTTTPGTYAVRPATMSDSHRNTLCIWYLPWNRSTSAAKVARLTTADLN